MKKDSILVGGEPHPNMTPSQTGFGGNRKQRPAARSHKVVLAYKCPGCGREILKLSKTRAERDHAVTAQRVRQAMEAHKRVTGCNGEVPSIGDHLPGDATGVEMICAGCGLIVATFPAKQAKNDPRTVQAEASRLLREHHVATGCPCEHDKTKAKPKRRDGRCSSPTPGTDVVHIDGCRCEVEQERKAAEAHERDLRAAEHPDHGVFKEMPS